jgi:hypothetical protein
MSHGCESQTEERFCLVNPALLEVHDCNGMVDEFIERASEEPGDQADVFGCHGKAEQRR